VCIARFLSIPPIYRDCDTSFPLDVGRNDGRYERQDEFNHTLEEVHHFYVTIGEAIRPEVKSGISLTFPSDADPWVSYHHPPLPMLLVGGFTGVRLPFA